VKGKRILKTTLAILAVLLLPLVLMVLFWLGPTAKAIAEGIGSKALGAPVTIEYLSINPRNGTIDLHGFQIGIHEGFSRSNTWELANFHVAVDMHSLFSDTIVIHEIQIDGPHFTYEQNQATDNISELIQSMQAFAGIDPDEPKKKKEQPAPGDAPAKESEKVVVERLEINDLQMHLANTADPQLDIQLGVEQFSLSLTNGVVQLKQLTLSDPGLLSTPNVFELEAIDIRLDPDSIYSERIVIEDIQVVKPRGFLERNAETDTVAEFMRLAQTFIDKLAQRPEPEAEAADTPPKPPPFELRNLFVDDIQLKLLDTTQTNAAHETRTLAAIGGISVRLVDGRIQIKDITIPNPEGFHTTNLFHLAEIAVALDPESVFSRQVVINEVLVDSPEINLEQTETSGNIAILQGSLMAFVPPASKTPADPKAAPARPAPAGPVPLAEMPVVLERLTVTNLALNMISPPETNLLENAFPMPSLGSLNPLASLAGGDTNATEEVAADDGFLTLIAFDRLSVEPLKGLIQLDNLQVGNPKGFANKNIVQLDEFRLDIDPGTLQADVMSIREILIDNPAIAYERKLTTDNIKSLQNFIADAAASPEEEKEKEPEAEEPAKDNVAQKVIIEHLLVKSGLVKAKLSALPSAPIPLPKIEMKDIGKEKGGASFIEAATEIGQKFYDSIIGAVSSTTGFATDALKGIGTLALPVAENEDTEIQVAPPKTIVAEPQEEPPSKRKKRRSHRRRIFPR